MGFDSLFGMAKRLILFFLLCSKYVCYSVSLPTTVEVVGVGEGVDGGSLWIRLSKDSTKSVTLA